MRAGGRMFLQLWHVGRISDPIYHDGALPVGPSAIAPKGNVSLIRPQRPYVAPRALKTEELADVVEAYRRGAENAKAAGFDGVEIHGANGYLLDQFLQDSVEQARRRLWRLAREPRPSSARGDRRRRFRMGSGASRHASRAARRCA